MIPPQLTQLRQVQTIGKQQMAKLKVAQVVAEMLAFNGPTLENYVHQPRNNGFCRSELKFDNLYILCAFVCTGEINKNDMQTFLRCWTTLKTQTALNRKIEDLFDVNDIPRTVATLHALKKALQFKQLQVFYNQLQPELPEQYFNSPYHWVEDRKEGEPPKVWQLEENKDISLTLDITFLNQVCGASMPMAGKKLTDFSFDARKRFCIQPVNWQRYRNHTREPISACQTLQKTTDPGLRYLQTRACRMCDPHRPKLIETIAQANYPQKDFLRCMTNEEYEDPSMLKSMSPLYTP